MTKRTSDSTRLILLGTEFPAAIPKSTDDEVAVHNRKRFGYRFSKRVFDIAFSLVVVVVLTVPVLFICLIIVLDAPGSPIFTQDRVGRGGKKLLIFKFRTMFSDAHTHPERYFAPKQMEMWKREQKVDDDPRVTPIGRILRKTSLDELPQFLNVLTGSMSIVGPRPVTQAETFEFGGHRDLVLSVRPGITGLWQVTERNGATWENGVRQRLELSYVRACSISLDLRVMGGTLGAMMRKTGM